MFSLLSLGFAVPLLRPLLWPLLWPFEALAVVVAVFSAMAMMVSDIRNVQRAISQTDYSQETKPNRFKDSTKLAVTKNTQSIFPVAQRLHNASSHLGTRPSISPRIPPGTMTFWAPASLAVLDV